jgi:hypothetical protein
MWGPTNPRRVLARAALVAATILAPVAARAETVSGDRIVIGEERITKATPSIASCEGGRGGSIRDTCRWTARKHQILRAALTNNIILTLHFDNRSAIGCPGIEASTATG